MKKNCFFLLFAIAFSSCKKEYACSCYDNRRGYVYVEYSKSYKERNKDKALKKCKNDYSSDPTTSNLASCEIK